MAKIHRFSFFILFLTLFNLISMHSFANIDKPDFAFPATVSKVAQKQLNNFDFSRPHTVAVQDQVVAYQIQDIIAQVKIDPQNLPGIIRELTVRTGEAADPSLRAMLATLLARCYVDYYRTDRWNFDKRNLPLSPLPKDISEWSGDMFRLRVTDIARFALDSLGNYDNVRIAEFKHSVVAKDSLSFLCYPTVTDFVAAQMIDLCNDVDADSMATEITDRMLSRVSPDSPAFINWSIRRAYHNKYGRELYLALQKLYSENASNPYSSLILLTLTNVTDVTGIDPAVDDEEPAVARDVDDGVVDTSSSSGLKAAASKAGFAPAILHAQIERSLTDNPSLPAELKSALAKALGKLVVPSVSLSYPSLSSTGRIVVNVSSVSAADIEIRAYAVPENIANDWSALRNLKFADPVSVAKVSFAEKAPFEATDSVILQLPSEGYFAIVPHIKGYDGKLSKNDINPYMLVRRVSVLPVAFSNVSNPSLALLNSESGAPVADAKVSAIFDWRPTAASGVTDRNGIVALGNRDLKSSHIVARVNGRKYTFRDIYLSGNRRNLNRNANARASVLTDRAIYHPGDTLHFLAVCSSLKSDADSSLVLRNSEVKVTLKDANYQTVDTLVLTTDNLGRASGSFTLPTDGLTGNFSIGVFSSIVGHDIGGASVTVSDYKMPQFEFADLKVSRDCPSPGSVTVDGRLLTYSGMPVADADVNVTLSSLSLWRWLSRDEDITSFAVKSDALGRFSAVFSPKMLDPDEYPDRFFMASFSATSQAGETVDGSASFSVGKPYIVTVDFYNDNINGELPLKVPFRMVDASAREQSAPMKWSLLDNDDRKVASGELSGTIDLSDVRPGSYRLSVEPVDSSLADPATARITVYNVKSGIVPSSDQVWCPVSIINDVDSAGRVLVATTGPETWLYFAVNIGDSLENVSVRRFAEGYHYIDLSLPDGCRSASVCLFAMRDCKVSTRSISVNIIEDRSLRISAETMRDRLTPGARETWKFRITDSDGRPVSAALVLDVYNKALEALRAHSLPLCFPSRHPDNTLSLRFDNAGLQRNYVRGIYNFGWPYVLPSPEFNFYNLTLSAVRVLGYGTANEGLLFSNKSSNTMVRAAVPQKLEGMAAGIAADMALEEVIVVEDAAAETAADGASDSQMSDEFSFRDADVPLALWAPMLTTDPDGCISFSFTVPDALTTWRLRAVSWDESTLVGSMMRDFIANKPLMVQPLLPRFLRQGDSTEILATVYNNSDSVLSASVVYELFDPLTGKVIASSQKKVTIDSDGSQVVGFPLSALSEGIESPSAVGVRVKAASDVFADGEQSVLPILSSDADLVETTPFYLNPGESFFSTKLPGEKNAGISLTYCDNPVWSIVSALPGLREQHDYANSAAAALFSACISRGILAENPRIAQVLKQWTDNPSDSALVSRLEQNEDLKIALLSATPWVQDAMDQSARMQRLSLIFDRKETDKAVASALSSLKKLQRADGGFSWGDWTDRSSYWVTSNVLCMMADLQRFGWLPSDASLRDMIVRALKYVDSSAEDTDMTYSCYRPMLKDLAPVSANGSKVIKATVSEISKHWKDYNAAVKAVAAEVLWLNGKRLLANELLASISEFGVKSDSQGIRIPSISSICEYAMVLDAYGMIDPESNMIDGLRQYLIVRKQANDWGSAVITSQVVKAILSSGTKWTDNQPQPEIHVGDVTIRPDSPMEAASGTLRIDLSPYAGSKLQISRGDNPDLGPAYGAVYTRFKQKMTDVKAVGCPDLSIEKKVYLQQGTGWVVPDSLKVGDRVKVSLTIKTSRNLSYVSLIDERPAAFAPVDQLPGWVWSDGAGFYRENRDSYTSLSIDYLRPGTYILEYEMNVQHAGRFSSGVASIQSQYAPELSAHSSGSFLLINPKD